MPLPTLTKPIAKLSDNQIINRMNRILAFFHKSSAGDPYGCDWPTMNMTFPNECEEYRFLKAEAISRLEKTGQFDGKPYTKTDGKWVVS